MTLLTQQKAQALNALAQISLVLTTDNKWVIKQDVEIKDGSILKSERGEPDDCPLKTIDKHWNKLTRLEPHQYLVTNAYGKKRKAIRWNGFMWQPIEEDKI